VARARTAYLGLGSNVGDRLANLRAAIELLDAHDAIAVVAKSSVYETEPVGEVLDQADFYNAAVLVETDLEPRELLAACKQVERDLGRRAGGVRHGPRPIDVDLLLIDDLALSDAELVVPHPQLANRRFVLAPLTELASELMLADGRTTTQALAAVGDGQRVTRVTTLG
jgi:2-amino-4-hydroxy-6-hydroxymethyldihydropteridine diphosphokinase